jgi:hypothetical protein
MVNTPVIEEPEALREERGRRTALMRLVEFDGADLIVTPPSRPGQTVSFRVSLVEGGRLRCTCAEFEERAVFNPNHRCEHIFAVQYSNVGEVGQGARGVSTFDPRARTRADLVTTGQLSSIRRAARAAGVDADEECGTLWRDVEYGELSKLAAQILIAHLEGLKARLAEAALQS